MRILSKAGAVLLSTAVLAVIQSCASPEVRFDDRLEPMAEFRVDYECRIGPGVGLSVAKSAVVPVPDSGLPETPTPKHAVVYKATFVNMPAAVARQVFGPWQVKAIGVHPANAQRVLDKLRGHPGVSILMAPTVTCLDGQRASLSTVSERSYVKVFKIEVAKEAMIGDPRVDVVRDGMLLEVHPKITESGDAIHSSVSVELASIDDMPKLDITLPSGRTQTIVTPVILRQKLSTKFEWHDGGTVAISGFFSKERNKFLAVFLTADIIDADQIKAPRGDGTRAVSLAIQVDPKAR